MAYLVNARTVGWLKKLKADDGQYLWTTLQGVQRSATPGEINGYSVARSNQVRANLTKGTSTGVCSEVFFGNWRDVLIGEWGVLEIVPNPYDSTLFRQGGILLRAMQSADVAIRHPESFAVMADALTA
jgi:HK97 family phage major capsid protein